jgi:tRNA (cytidine/uridine-2'-O-)-methyltransferase
MRFQVVLVEPEIPQNTGSIGRLCLATQSTLHLVEPLGFEISHAKLRRAGLDYWKHLQVHKHPDWQSFASTLPALSHLVFFSKKSQISLFEYRFHPGSYLIFGKETQGLPEALLKKYSEVSVVIPMWDERVRSLNLANAASIVLYEAIRQNLKDFRVPDALSVSER